MSDYINHECSSVQHGFSYIHNTTHGESVSASHVDKDLFSVFVLLKGELDYIVEGNLLHLSPQDILIVGNNELHQSILKKDTDCEYILLMINLDFFIKNNCTELTDIVFNRVLGSNNLINADRVTQSAIHDIFKRLDSYTKEQPTNLTVVSCVIVELLYNLNKQVEKTKISTYNQQEIKNIIEYINNHLTEKLTLEHIAKQFYITPQYLCKVFKKSTGITVLRYIAYKRIVLVREYRLKGMSLTAACEKAGFNDYSSFYRACSKITKESPRQSIS